MVWAKTKDLRDSDKRPPFQVDTHISCWWVLERWVSILLSIYSCSFSNCAPSSMLINGYAETHVVHGHNTLTQIGGNLHLLNLILGNSA